MQSAVNWINGMKFEGLAEGHAVLMDAKSPIGSDSAMTPKELIALGLGGCTAMDVIALLKKHKQGFKTLNVALEITTSSGVQPAVFTEALMTYTATGEIDKNILLDAIRLSQTKYCGVSAMLSKAFPIHYLVHLNGEAIGEGRADFGGSHE